MPQENASTHHSRQRRQTSFLSLVLDVVIPGMPCGFLWVMVPCHAINVHSGLPTRSWVPLYFFMISTRPRLTMALDWLMCELPVTIRRHTNYRDRGTLLTLKGTIDIEK